MRVIIGADVGGTTISAGLVTREGEILSAAQMPTHVGGAGTAVQTLLELIRGLVVEAAGRGFDIEGIGVGIPGAIDPRTRVMRSLPFHHVSELFGVPLAERIQAKTGLPAFIDNDVNALALGEWTYGAARGARSLAVLALGTGAGGAVIVGGTLVRGHGGYAGEFGHVPVQFSGPPCPCGGRGCLCLYVGGLMIGQKARERLAHQPASILAALVKGDLSAVTPRMVFEAAAQGDPLARGIVEEACEALGVGLAVIVNTVNPEVIVVTGGVSASFVPLEDEVLRCARKYTIAHALAGTRVTFVTADKSQTVRGGAALVLYELSRRKEAQDAEVPGRA